MAELSLFHQAEMKKKLARSANLQEAFDILGEYYDLENCKPGLITKGVLIGKLSKAVTELNAQPRKQFTR